MMYLGSVLDNQRIEREIAKLEAEKKGECVWCGEPNATDSDVCSEKCAAEQAYADRMNEENAKADGAPIPSVGACPVCGETNRHVCGVER